MQLTLISFNTFGVPFDGNNLVKSFLRTNIRKRFKLIGKELNQLDTDIIALQEVYTYPHLNILRKEMTSYKYCYYKKFLIGPRGGVVTFSKIPMGTIKYKDFRSKGSMNNKSIVGRISKRGILTTKIHGFSTYILNTHLTQNSDHDWAHGNKYVPVLKAQLEEIKSILSLLQNSTVFLLGDFNLPKNSEIYYEFIKNNKLIDLFGQDITPTYRGHAIYKNVSGKIDYIFSNQQINTLSYSYIFQNDKIENGSFLSDHIGLKATLTINDSHHPTLLP